MAGTWSVRAIRRPCSLVSVPQQVMASQAHTLAEGAGAAALAAVLARPDHFAGRRIAVVCTGGNASAAEIAALGAA
jgi:threonine dehydratase